MGFGENGHGALLCTLGFSSKANGDPFFMHESGDRLNVFSHEYDVEQPKPIVIFGFLEDLPWMHIVDKFERNPE